MYGASETVEGGAPLTALESYFFKEKRIQKNFKEIILLKTAQVGKIGFKEGVDNCSNPDGRYLEETRGEE